MVAHTGAPESGDTNETILLNWVLVQLPNLYHVPTKRRMVPRSFLFRQGSASVRCPFGTNEALFPNQRIRRRSVPWPYGGE